MVIRLFFSICLVFNVLSVLGQNVRLTGRVQDEQHRPVPYASVALLNGASGTATNEVGEFSLVVPALPQRLVILSIGYVRTEVPVTTAAPLTLTLPASAVQLPEVTVRNPQRVAEELVQRAFAKLARHRKDTYYGKAFYRQKTQNNGTYDEFFDAFYDVRFTPQRIEGWDLGESRYAYSQDHFHMTNFSSLVRQIPVFTSKGPIKNSLSLPLAPNSAQRFVFTLRTVLTAQGRETAVIDFMSRPGPPQRGSATGTLYIDQRDATLLRQQVCLVLGDMLKVSSGMKMMSDSLRITSEFAPWADSLSRLASIRSESTMIFQQAGSQKTSRISSYLFMYQYTNKLAGHAYQEVARKSRDLELLKARPYNAQFWRDNEMIRASPIEAEIIRSFEGRKVFGRL